ncbi:hypothetical protein QUA11_16750 [Microcoleus sp. S13_D1]
MLVATIIDSCSLLKRDLTADSGGYSSKHYYYSPGNLDAFALGARTTRIFILLSTINSGDLDYDINSGCTPHNS